MRTSFRLLDSMAGKLELSRCVCSEESSSHSLFLSSQTLASSAAADAGKHGPSLSDSVSLVAVPGGFKCNSFRYIISIYKPFQL